MHSLRSHFPRVLATWILSIVLVPLLPRLGAQAAPPPPPPPPADAKSAEVVTLSPFTVSAEASQEGYLAKQTLAATRIRTDLKDVGASIDVLTEAFMNDMGILDLGDALRSVANMSNYEGSADSNDALNNRAWFTFAFNSRGFIAENALIDFFPFEFVPIDRYATENMTFLRGPNAILFGIGNPGGSASSSYKRANLGRNAYSVSHVTDTYSSQRYEFDANQVILKKRLALRISGVDQERHKFKRPSLDGRRAIHGSATFRPFDRTALTVSAEDGQREFLWEVNNVIFDQYTPWVLAGRPTVNWQTGAGQNAPGKGAFTRSLASGLALAFGGNNLVYVEGSRQPIQNWIGMARGVGWDANASVPTFDRGALAFISLSEANNSLRTPDGREWKLELDANYWGDVNRHKTNYRTKSVFLEQGLLPGLNLELAANQFTMHYDWNAFANARPILQVDPNQLLPDGSPNPNVGRPYLETGREQVHRERREHLNRRATLAYEVDLERRKIFRGIGLGRYRLLGLWEDQDRDVFLAVGRTVNTTPLPGYAPALSNAQNQVIRRYYLQPGESRFVAQGDIHAIEGTGLGTGINLATIMASEPPRRSFKSVESKVGALQAQWWQARGGFYRIVGLYGRRQDTVLSRAMRFVAGANGVFPGDFRNYESAIQSGTWGANSEVTVQTRTYSVVLRPLEQLSFSYNYSDLFNSGDPNFRDIFGQPLRSTYGDTRDYGARLSLLKDRLSLTVTRFETVQFDQRFQSTNTFVLANRIWEAIPGRESQVLPTFFAYRNDSTKGLEFGLGASLAGWNLRMTGGKQESVISKYANEVQAYLDTHRAEWQQHAARPLLNPTAVLQTVGDMITEYQRQVNDARAIIGRRQLNIPRYNAALNATYTFSRGERWWKGLSVGTGIRWAQSVAVGYARTPAGLLDLGRPYRGADSFNIDLNAGYSRQLFRNRVRWHVYLNVFNLLDQSDIMPRTKIDSGNATHDPITTQTFLPAPRWLQVRNTFSF